MPYNGLKQMVRAIKYPDTGSCRSLYITVGCRF
jgi:hypothetical protein